MRGYQSIREVQNVKTADCLLLQGTQDLNTMELKNMKKKEMKKRDVVAFFPLSLECTLVVGGARCSVISLRVWDEERIHCRWGHV